MKITLQQLKCSKNYLNLIPYLIPILIAKSTQLNTTLWLTSSLMPSTSAVVLLHMQLWHNYEILSYQSWHSKGLWSLWFFILEFILPNFNFNNYLAFHFDQFIVNQTNASYLIDLKTFSVSRKTLSKGVHNYMVNFILRNGTHTCTNKNQYWMLVSGSLKILNTLPDIIHNETKLFM